MSTGEILAISVIITTLIFIMIENKKIKELLTSRKENRATSEEIKEIEKIMEEKNISFNEAAEIFADREVMKIINISKTEWDVGNGIVLKQGDRVSFIDEEIGYIQGNFFGLIEPKAVGYGNVYIIKKPDNTFRQAPVAYVKKDTINVYKQ